MEGSPGAPAPRRSKRERVTHSDLQNQNLVTAGYRKFAAAEMQVGDGEAHCIAILHVKLREGSDAVAGVAAHYEGSTAHLNGHAEVDALTRFVTAVGFDAERFRRYDLSIQCEDKSCCIRCSALMGLIGAEPEGRTYKCRDTMLAGGAWGLTPPMRTFLGKLLKVEPHKFEEMATQL